MPALLEINGVSYPNVYAVDYSIYTERDHIGKPSSEARGGVIRIVRESDEKTEICSWATNSKKENFKPGKVTFKSASGKVLKELSWKDGFITHYEEHVPHVKERPTDQPYEYFEISAREIKVKDATVINPWVDK